MVIIISESEKKKKRNGLKVTESVILCCRCLYAAQVVHLGSVSYHGKSYKDDRLEKFLLCCMEGNEDATSCS